MRVLLISPFFHPHKGGSQLYMEELWFHVMKAHPNVTVDVLTYNTDRVSSVEKYRGFTVYRIPCWNVLPGQFAIPNYFSITSLLRKLTKTNKYDVIHANTRFFESSWWAPFVSRHFNIPSILTDHCANSPVHHSPPVSFIARCVDRYIVPFFANRFTTVTVTNEATKQYVAGLGIKNPRVFYGGVDTTLFSPKKKKSTKTTAVTFVGRMIPSKGPELLFEAVQKIISSYPNMQVTFVGGGELYEKMHEKKTPQIHFIGPKEKNEIAKILRTTDIFVHPSIHHEGFPNALLEAGASGCAVIATDRGGTNEIIMDGKTGIIVEPDATSIAHAIERLMDTKLRENYGTALHKHVYTHFSWARIARELYTFLFLGQGDKKGF